MQMGTAKFLLPASDGLPELLCGYTPCWNNWTVALEIFQGTLKSYHAAEFLKSGLTSFLCCKWSISVFFSEFLFSLEFKH